MSRPVGVQALGQDEHACRRGGEGPFQDNSVRPDSNKSADIHAKYGRDGSSGSGNKNKFISDLHDLSSETLHTNYFWWFEVS